MPKYDIFGDLVYSPAELKEKQAKEKIAKKELEDARKKLKKDLETVLDYVSSKNYDSNGAEEDSEETGQEEEDSDNDE